ncbi:MAG: ABC transporter ATP-binding protein [Muribaculaceae bacterium]|nr:ABC transporter ATP-binding protein [Muribaculaceae bacterium]
MITLDHITYSYPRSGGARALEEVTGTLEPGIHLLMGENGAGKSTLLRVMAGLARPLSGHCLLDGTDTTQTSPNLRRRIFFLPDSLEIPTETIRDFAGIHSVYYPEFSAEAFEQNLSDFGLTGNEKLKGLSLGMSGKAKLAYVLALGVDMLLLDEPANGLDITSRKLLRSMMARSISDSQTIVVSTHSVADLKALYDGVLMVSHGHLKVCAPTWEIASRLIFVSTSIPDRAAIFTEQESGRFNSIIPSEKAASEATTDVDFALLYSALLSERGEEIVKMINCDYAN